jgi:ABC-2 type transport system permease protein
MSTIVRREARGSVAAIVRRDLTVVGRSRAVVLPIILLPLILFLGLPLLVTGGMMLGGDQLQELEQLLAMLPDSIRSQLGQGSLQQVLTVYLLEYQFAAFFLIVPLMVSAVIAADSFAGEKERKTLEALLYTPTTDLELYVAKLLGPWLAALAVVVGSFVIYALTANLAAGGAVDRLLVVTPLWLLIVFWLSPAVAALGLGVLVQVSARVRGFQEAYQLGGLIVIPVVILIMAQLAGVVFLDATLAFVLGAVVWAIAAAAIWFGYRAFRRERLLLST